MTDYLKERTWAYQIAKHKGDRVKAAIGILRLSQHSHIEWRDWKIVNPNAPEMKGRGGPEFDQQCIDDYEEIIRTIQDLSNNSNVK